MATNDLHPDLGFYKAQTSSNLEQIGLGKLTLTKEGEAEIGYMLFPAFWSKGYGTEITAGLIQYARTLQHLHTLIAIIHPGNVASKRILEKAGFDLDEMGDSNGLSAAIYRMYLS